MKEDLKKLGLTDNEIKVYLSLLKIGETSVGGIIDDLKIHRQIAYNALDSLEKKNMVTKTVINKVAQFALNDPGIIIENLHKQELIAKRLSKTIKEEMKKSKHEHEILVFDGYKMIRDCFLSNYKKIPDNSVLYALNATGERFKEILGEEYLKKTEEVRNLKGIITKHVTVQDYKDDIEEFIKDKKEGSRQIKYLPYNLSNPIATVIWPDSVMFQSFFGEVPFMIVIKNEEFRNTFYEHFNMLWKISKK